MRISFALRKIGWPSETLWTASVNLRTKEVPRNLATPKNLWTIMLKGHGSMVLLEVVDSNRLRVGGSTGSCLRIPLQPHLVEDSLPRVRGGFAGDKKEQRKGRMVKNEAHSPGSEPLSACIWIWILMLRLFRCRYQHFFCRYIAAEQKACLL